MQQNRKHIPSPEYRALPVRDVFARLAEHKLNPRGYGVGMARTVLQRADEGTVDCKRARPFTPDLPDGHQFPAICVKGENDLGPELPEPEGGWPMLHNYGGYDWSGI